MKRSIALPLAGLLALVFAVPCRAQVIGSDSYQRAGNPLEQAPWARPSDTGRYVGYYVGGGSGSARKGEPPLADEGTWGWDYQGGLFKRRVILNWWHGRRTQGGVGAYETDGPVLRRER
jgi:hypothetical protein